MAATPRPDRPGTEGQRWRFRRGLVMLAAARAGLSRRLIADVFDLAHSEVGYILGRMEAALAAGGEIEHPGSGASREPPTPRAAKGRRKSGHPRPRD